MLRISRSNRVEKLADVLASALQIDPPDPMETDRIVVSNLGMRVFLQRALASRLGISAGIAFPFQREVLDSVCLGPDAEKTRFREETVALAVFETLPTLLETTEFESLRGYLLGDAEGVRRLGLARKIAHVFNEYTLFRPEMILKWEAGGGREWQAVLWRDIVKRLGGRHIARAAVDFLRQSGRDRTKNPFRRLFFFAEPSFPPLYLAVLRVLSEMIDVHLLLLSPSREWWGDIRTEKRLFIDGIHALDDASMTETDNPFLTSLGKIGRDFQWLLEETVVYEESLEPLYVDPFPGPRATAMMQLQSDMLNLRFGPVGGVRPPLDDSIRIVSCHGPEREVEVLKDQLLDLFDKRPGLGPDEVLVMAPDMTPYLPFVEAVFGAGPDRLPFNLTLDTGPAELVPRAFAAILSLVGSRLPVSDILDVLSYEPVRRRFSLDEQAVLDAETWLVEAGVRWGLDADHRIAHGQPGFAENTWRFGLDRLLLAVAVDPDDAPMVEKTAPTPGLPQDRIPDLGNLVHFLETLFGVLADLTGEHPVSEWLDRFERALKKLFLRDPVFETGYQRVVRHLSDLREAAEHAGMTTAVPFSATRKLLAARLTAEASHKGWHPFGVTFSDFATMRAVPFNVIALLGMNEGAFPRRRHPPGFDHIARAPRIGDRQVTQDDRYQFLETLLSVRDTLVLSYEGQDTKDNTLKSPSVLVSELAENLARCFDTAELPIEVRHPLQPFALPYFTEDGDPRLFSFNTAHLAGAEARLRRDFCPARFFPTPLKHVDTATVIPLQRLLQFFSKPAVDVLLHRLGMRFPRGAALAEPREPMQRGGPEERLILDAVVRLGGEGMDTADLYPRFRAAGLLPHGSAGIVRFRRLLEDAEPIIETAMQVKTGTRLQPVEVDVETEGDNGSARIVGTLDGLWENALLSYGYALLSGRALLRAWVRHLVLAALARPDLPLCSLLVGRKPGGGAATVRLSDPLSDPRVLLSDLVALFRIGSDRPIRLLPNASFEFATLLEKGTQKAHALVKVRDAFSRSFEGADPRLAVAFRDTDLFGPDPLGPAERFSLSFENLAERVFYPMMDAMERGSI